MEALKIVLEVNLIQIMRFTESFHLYSNKTKTKSKNIFQTNIGKVCTEKDSSVFY